MLIAGRSLDRSRNCRSLMSTIPTAIVSTTIITTATVTTIPTWFPLFATRLTARFWITSAARPVRDNFSLIDPGLDTNYTVGRVGLSETIINVGAQSVQRQLTM